MNRALFTTLAFTLLISPAFAQLAPPATKPHSSFLITYAKSLPGPDDSYDFFAADIFSTDTDGRPESQLTDSSCNVSPLLSPDGSRIAFVQLQRSMNIIVMNPDGSHLRKLASFSSLSGSLSWSPDGKFIAYMDVPNGSNLKAMLYVVPVEPAAPAKSPPKPVAASYLSDAAWSPEGDWLAYKCLAQSKKSPIQLCVVRPSDPASAKPVSDLNIAGYSWSPDGTKLAFTAGQRKSPGLFVAKLDGSAPVALTQLKAIPASFDWSPDSKQILFTDLQGRDSAIFRINADGSSRERLTDPKLQADSAYWSADARQIALSAMDHGNRSVFLLNLDNSEMHKVVAGLPQCSPTGWLSGTSLLFIRCAPSRKSVADIPANARKISAAFSVLDASESQLPVRKLADLVYGDVSIAQKPDSTSIRSLDSLSVQ
jgi:Tol biopolymer transport system component